MKEKERQRREREEREQPILGQAASEKQSWRDSGNRHGDLEDCSTATWSGGTQDPEALNLARGTRQQ